MAGTPAFAVPLSAKASSVADRSTGEHRRDACATRQRLAGRARGGGGAKRTQVGGGVDWRRRLRFWDLGCEALSKAIGFLRNEAKSVLGVGPVTKGVGVGFVTDSACSPPCRRRWRMHGYGPGKLTVGGNWGVDVSELREDEVENVWERVAGRSPKREAVRRWAKLHDFQGSTGRS